MSTTPYDAEDRQETEREEHRRRQRDDDPSRVDLAYGGLSIMAKGSIVVLVLLILAGTGVILYSLGTQTVHFDDALKFNEAHLVRQDTVMLDTTKDIVRLHSSLAAQVDILRDEIVRNRLFLREIERVCILTPSQRERLQQNLSPAMRELLRRGESPLEEEAARREQRHKQNGGSHEESR